MEEQETPKLWMEVRFLLEAPREGEAFLRDEDMSTINSTFYFFVGARTVSLTNLRHAET